MAEVRTTDKIEESMLADKATRTPLAPITTTSNASVFRSLVKMFAVAANLHEETFAAFAAEIEERAGQIQTGIPRWYAAESLVFQYGDALQYVDGNLVYPVEDESKQIVKLAAADVENGFLVIKVAALDGSGNARPLTAAELTAFKGYWSDKKFACTPLTFISQFGDVARIGYRIGVDATVIDPETGQLLSDPTVYPVEDAINSLLRTYQSERFNSMFRITQLTDTIQSVPGVVNPIPESIQIRPSDGVFTDVLAEPNDEYLARAGFIVHDTTANFTLRDLLNYYDA